MGGRDCLFICVITDSFFIHNTHIFAKLMP